MSIVQTLIGSVVSSSGGYTPPTPTYTITLDDTNVNEGTLFGVVFSGTNIPDGTYYWTVNSEDFVTTSGSIVVNGNIGSFEITPTADTTTEGAETFTVSWRSGSVSGTILATSDPVTINDTSLTPLVPPFSLDFPAGNPYLLVSNTQADWNLGNTYTIEFWSKSASSSSPSAIRTVMSQGPDSGQIDLGMMQGGLLISNSQVGYAEPTPGEWTHVAYVRNGVSNTQLYYNGVNQTQFNMTLNNGSSDLNIGRRAGINGQGFLGKLAMIRISNTAKYLDNFSPSLSYGRESDTRLMLGSNNPLTDLALYELNGIATSQSNGGTIYFSKATYPDLNNQIRAGDTVVDTANNQTSTLTGAVFTADPDNWGVNVSSLQSSGTKNFSGPGRHPISVQGAVTTSMDFPSFQSLEFNQPQGDFLSTPASNDWNLGTTGTIEFWIKANNASSANINIPGGQWGLINQGGWYYGMPDDNCILVGLAGGKLSIAQSNTDDVQYTEPTAGQWTHVAVVYNSGTQKVYYNGVEQTKTSGNYLGNGWTNTTSDIYIGRLAPNYASHFDGKLAMVRISSFAKYTGTFTPTTTYGVEGDTRLFLSKVNPTVDSKAHAITNNGVTTSTTFVNIHTATHALANGGSSDVWILSNPANDAWAASMPVGATIISSASGRHTVTSVGRDQSGQNWIIGAGTGGYGIFVAGETHTFIW